ncbi:adenosylmethionine-8-amino-7-oxononanoate transaminase [Teredinibacter turnerae T7901]|uniref:Adenosylmethionine-8-amino-7-oxononanoate aminotransferase n=1 Tax=Teredinibacter turnerae (strain ATCC 39867 / T7901) TaxID=377629 RepID=C5BRQ4_TERTT|nr:adenosylmethionine--8-amino-7-oxononanoate transaminase [Teredinibacter turnerae]ACR13594.1 adenosylmethionine-8-amino-7-oxononanoate transaminase [Teredinibacter turnerae T7901]
MQKTPYSPAELLALDKQHVWHPYASVHSDVPVFPVARCEGVEIVLATGERLIDGMASWWSAIHGYNHPTLNAALTEQMADMSHVMFGGLTHQPAVHLSKLLVDITPGDLSRVFFSDSGSVAVEVALKMALQFWQAQGQANKQRILSFRNGYHGDTFAAMSVCDPVTGMHRLFEGVLAKQLFAPAPPAGFSEALPPNALDDVEQLLASHHEELAAVIIEPIVQGAGGMRFYSPEFLAGLHALCRKYNVLFIADEIATGLGRTGKWFACEHAGISPDILCLGKTLTAGYITLAATLCNDTIADIICSGDAGCFMHGPTYMGNPLACAVAARNIEMLQQSDWQREVARISAQLSAGLAPCRSLPGVVDVRVLGAIGVIELAEPVDMAQIEPAFVEAGIWLRPFGKLVYMMPPYIITDAQIEKLTSATYSVLQGQLRHR